MKITAEKRSTADLVSVVFIARCLTKDNGPEETTIIENVLPTGVQGEFKNIKREMEKYFKAKLICTLMGLGTVETMRLDIPKEWAEKADASIATMKLWLNETHNGGIYFPDIPKALG